MDASRFNRFTRARTAVPSRRVVLQGLVATVLGLAPAVPPSAVHPKKRKKKLKRNAFGCVDVGGKCRGKDSVCCSGICQGKKPKQGEKDRSRCVAHDTGGCQAGQTDTFCGPSGQNVDCTSSAGRDGVCVRTTGNAGYCLFARGCMACTKDADCQPACGPHAACVVCAGCAQGTACVGPGPDACQIA
ncbi:MAG: hypothetical protein ACRDJC_15170 [Thermomicrobiales bacterium]